jgi:hypothetical protein
MNAYIAIFLALFLSVPVVSNAQDGSVDSLLKHVRPQERIRGVQILGSTSSETDLLKLIPLLEDSDPFVRSAVRNVLVEKGDFVWNVLVADVHSDKSTGRIVAANGLVNLLGRESARMRARLNPELNQRIMDTTSFVRCNNAACLEQWVLPRYPVLAVSARISGRVWATFEISSDGSPQNITLDGHPILGDGLPEIIRQWRFRTTGPASIWTVLFDFQIIAGEPGRAVAMDMVLPGYVLIASRPPGIEVVQ